MNAKKLIRIKIALIVIVALFSVKLAAQDTITFTWKVEGEKYLSCGATIGKEFTINWGDGTIDTKTYYYYGLRHTYAKQGEYTVTIAASTADCRFTFFSCEGSDWNMYERNHVGSLILIGCSELQSLGCGYNEITELDITGCPKLEGLSCYANQLTSLDLTGCPNLRFLDIAGNQITDIDVTGCPNLEFLFISQNQITDIDVTGCSNLRSIGVEHNQLTNLDLSNCPDLKIVWCNNNHLSSLDLPCCRILQVLSCSNNRLQLSNLFALDLLTKQSLGSQYLLPQTAIIGEELFGDQSVFNGIFTRYSVTPNGNPASESDYTVVDGKLTFNTVGIYTVAMTNEAITSSHQVIAEITVEKGTGIAETLHATSLQVFPNPTNGELRITNQESGIGNIEIFDATGKSVFKKQLSIINHQLSIDISHLPAGIYFLHVDEQTVKVVKK